MRAFLERYSHSPGFHCISSAARNYLNYCGIALSECAAFGLDACLGFYYEKHDVREKMPPVHTGGRSVICFRNMCRTLRLPHERIATKDTAAAWEQAKRLLAVEGKPVIAEVSLAHLPYWRKATRANPFHLVIVAGYDDEEERVWLGDVNEPAIDRERLDSRLHETALSAFLDARSKPYHWGEIENAWHKIDIPARYELDPKGAFAAAIRLNADNYLDDREQCGVKAFAQFLGELADWPDIIPSTMRDEATGKKALPLRTQLYYTGMMLGKVGNGGGNFRYLYAGFIREAASLYGDDASLHDAGERFRQSACIWAEAGKQFEKLSIAGEGEISAGLKRIRALLQQCFDTEQRAFEKLRAWSSIR